MRFTTTLLVLVATTAFQGAANAEVSETEARQLGVSLTLFGAEKAGNKAGTIPEYTGGLPVTTAPPGFAPNSGRWTDPFASEKPLYSIDARTMAKHADALSEGVREFMRRTPEFRIDVYPSHRTVNYPKYVLDNTVANATRARAAKDNLSVEGALNGIPFPIPKTGYEVMWNHLMRYAGAGQDYALQNIYVDANGKQIMSGAMRASMYSPYYKPGITGEELRKAGGWFFMAAYNFTGPARIAGDCSMYLDNIDPVENPRRSWSYSASTRRVRLSPDIAYDTPIATTGGVRTYDDTELFSGKMDRFDFKLIGKKELIIPYNSYRAQFDVPPETLLGSRYMDPGAMRWELHRVWVVEATLKPEYRHTYSKRMFYLDEDWSGAGMSDMWDGAGKLFRFGGQTMVQLYDVQRPISKLGFTYDMSTGMYTASQVMSAPKTYFYAKDELPMTMFTPDALASRSGR